MSARTVGKGDWRGKYGKGDRWRKDVDFPGVRVYPESTAEVVLDDTVRFVEQLSAFAKTDSALPPNKRPRVGDTSVKVEGGDGLEISDDEDQDEGGAAVTLPLSETVMDMFHWDEPIFVTRAPGRLDVMGGIADYSGSLVLQMPIAEACHVALQIRNLEPTQKQSRDGQVTVVSLGQGESPTHRVFREKTAVVFDDRLGAPKALTRDDPSIAYLRNFCQSRDGGKNKWSSYVLGVLQVLMHGMRDGKSDDDETGDSDSGKRFPGFNPNVSVSVFIESLVPEGAGVSSSAALETAVAYAARAALREYLPKYLQDSYSEEGGTQIAKWCQLAENLVADSPCGVMDQMASGLGMQDCLLALQCRPCHVVYRGLPIPEDMFFLGIDSGNTHSVGGGDYGHVRAAAFMCRTIVAKHLGREHEKNEHGNLVSLTEMIAPSQFDALQMARVGAASRGSTYLPPIGSGVMGRDFLTLFPNGHGDNNVTTIDQTKRYDVTAAGKHPVFEHERVRGFLAVLLGLIKIREARGADVVKMMGNDYDADDYTMHVLGELMYQSHGSYSGLGLGNFGTDALVNAVRAVKRGAGDDRATALFGAKITGGGCGGTVCVLGRKKPGRDSEYARKDALDAVEGIRTEYAAKNQGKIPTLFLGSSPGAVAYGHLKLGFKE